MGCQEKTKNNIYCRFNQVNCNVLSCSDEKHT